MNKEILSALKNAILKSLPLLEGLSAQHQEQYLFWCKDGTGWRGQYGVRPSLFHIFNEAQTKLSENSTEFTKLFFKEFPEYGPGKLVGVDGLGAQQIATQIFSTALTYLWAKNETFRCPDADVDTVVDEFEQFVEQPTIPLLFQAPLVNFRMSADTVSLIDGVVIRRLSEREVSAFNGGSLMTSLTNPLRSGILEFMVEGECNGTKITGSMMGNAISAQRIAREEMEKILISLRTFKEGHVGYDWIHFKCARFCPLAFGSSGSIDRYVRPDTYNLTSEEVALLPGFAKQILWLSESALDTACARLADAETRLRAEDQILDAVIGMEALLLAGLAEGDRRSELKYRFSMNYSTLFEQSLRREAYNIAKSFYDHRSVIAHGGNIGKNNLRLGSETLNIHEVARRSKDALRKIIKHFLPHAHNKPYKKPGFWEDAYFGPSELKSIN